MRRLLAGMGLLLGLSTQAAAQLEEDLERTRFVYQSGVLESTQKLNCLVLNAGEVPIENVLIELVDTTGLAVRDQLIGLDPGQVVSLGENRRGQPSRRTCRVSFYQQHDVVLDHLIGHLTVLDNPGTTTAESELRLTAPAGYLPGARLDGLLNLEWENGAAIQALGQAVAGISGTQNEQSTQLNETVSRVAELQQQVAGLQDQLWATVPPPPALSCRVASAQVTICGAGGACSTMSYPCAPYACDAARGTCRSQCTTNTECASGNTCDDKGQCVVSGNTCSDLFSVKQPNGNVVSCNGFKCLAGACQQQCQADNECKTDESYRCLSNVCIKQQFSACQGDHQCNANQGYSCQANICVQTQPKLCRPYDNFCLGTNCAAGDQACIDRIQLCQGGDCCDSNDAACKSFYCAAQYVDLSLVTVQQCENFVSR